MDISFYDLLGIILTSLLISRIARRGGHPRYATLILLGMSLQLLGMCLLFYGIYLSQRLRFIPITLDSLILPGLLMHAMGGIGMTIILAGLIHKLWVAAKHRADEQA